MEMNRRVKDVSEVFDKQWNANHSYQEVKKQSEERKRHFNRMYQIEDISEKKRKFCIPIV